MEVSGQLELFPAKGKHHLLKHEFQEGQRFGRLVTVDEVQLRKGKQWVRFWICQCDCGTVRAISVSNLVADKASSCSCLRDEKIARVNLQHGLSGTPEHGIWMGMIQRCENPNQEAYADYGGRGIKVCERWRDFANFYTDMGPRPSPEHSIDRYPDNDGDYRPGNVRWTTAFEQVHNRRPRRRLTHCGHGHEFTSENTHLTRNGHQSCRACGREHARNQRKKKRGESVHLPNRQRSE